MVEITRRSAKQSTEVLIAADAYDYVTFGFRQQPQTSSESSFELVSPSSGLQDSTSLATTTPSKLDETEGFEEIDRRDLDLQSISSTETEPTTIVENVRSQEPEEVKTPTATIEKEAPSDFEFVEVSSDLALVGQPKEEQSTVKASPAIVEIKITAEEPSSMTSSLSDAGQPPKFRLGLAPSTFRCGRAAQLKCIVTALPTPEIRWLVDGDPIVSGP
jgi:hypothetical protein